VEQREQRAIFETELEELVATARSFTAAEWETPSLCPDWTVRDVVVHVAFHLHRTSARDLVGNLEKATARSVAEQHAETTEGLVVWLASTVPERGARSTINLSELVIHQQDIRRPLGLLRRSGDAAVRRSLDLCATRRGNAFVIGRVRRLGHGLQLTATDIDWTRGSGDEVRGTADDILLAIAGRRSAMHDLTGPGADVIRGRADALPKAPANHA
jgi:uncharacterized protein (TIGR03083 family)